MTILLYVAGAYDGDIDKNIARAELVSLNLIRNGFHVITPHKNTAGYEQYEDGASITRETWIDMDKAILERCDCIYVMKNWHTSKGTKIEIEHAGTQGVPIIYEDDIPSIVLVPGMIYCEEFGGKECKK